MTTTSSFHAATVACLLLLASVGLMVAHPAGAWNGWAQCQVDTIGTNYFDRQTHTWVLAGTAPAMQGGFAIHAATWSAVGAGAIQRTPRSQPSQAEWTTSVSGVGAPLAISIRPSDTRIVVRPWHDRLGVNRGIQGLERLVMPASADAGASTPLVFQAWESTFPTIERSAGSVISGSSTLATNGTTSPMPPAGATRTSSCSWEFAPAPAQVSSPPSPVALSAGLAP